MAQRTMDIVARWLLPTVLAGVIVVACSPFGEAPGDGGGGGGDGGDGGAPDASSADDAANDGPTLCVDACSSGALACKSFGFEGANCPPELTAGGDPGNVTCNGGSLHVFADGTLDATASIGVMTPASSFTARISVQAVIKEWRRQNADPSRRLMDVVIDGTRLVQLRAFMNNDGTVGLVSCGTVTVASTCKALAPTTADVPHRIAVALSADGAAAVSIDCTVVSTHPPTGALGRNKTLDVVFGDTDGEAIDGRFDDLLIDFAPAR